MAADKKKRYRALVGLNWPDAKPGKPERRAEPGDVVDDLPTSALPNLLESGAVEEVK